MKRYDISGWFFYGYKVLFERFRRKVFTHIIRSICYLKGIKHGKGTIYVGFPYIGRYPKSKITIGERCMFNSLKWSVSIGIPKACSFITLNSNAEISIGNDSGASGTTFVSAKKIKVGRNVFIGGNSVVSDYDFHPINPGSRFLKGDKESAVSKEIIIKDNAFIGFNCIIMKGVTIGENAVIGAGSIVFSNIPDNAIASGNPCKVIIKRNWPLQNVGKI